MPYASIEDLPRAVRAHLPRRAQHVYRAAFNAAYEHYGPEHEAIAHRIAWAAVKRQYVQVAAGLWRARAGTAHA